jgi:hypothetical protein
MKKSIIILCSIILLSVYIFTGIRDAHQRGHVDTGKFKDAELTGKITWIGGYHKGDGIKVNESYEIYAVTGLYDVNGHTFYGIATKGDSVRKAASSSVLYLYKSGTGQPIVFNLKKD